jgi:hypothetical protein
MRKTILIFALIVSAVAVVTSCKETKKEDSSIENHENHNHDQHDDSTTAAKYQCPMDCEKGKTYDAAGTCPVCKMDLKPVKSDSESDKQAMACKCTEGEPCTCEEGTCECGTAVAEKQKDCKMCEPGACQCKA